MKTRELVDFGFPKEAAELLLEEGIRELFPPQEAVVKEGLLDLEDSFVVSVPTASGKTLIAELLMVHSILKRGGKCLYIVPLRALASEKLEEFRKYEALGIKTAVSTGELDSKDSWLGRYDIIVTTSEKADSLLRHKSEWLGAVNVLVADEIHLIHDGHRGPTLEITIAKMRHLNPSLLVLGLSATIKNSKEIAGWLEARLVESDWRPVTLKEGVHFDREILFNDSSVREVPEATRSPPMNLALDTIKEGGQALVFVNTRKGAERFALDATPEVGKLLQPDEIEELQGLSQAVLEVLGEPTRICRRLSRALAGGTAFHHAGLAAAQKKIVEEAFKRNLIKVLSATPTLAAGVNLPARRVIIRDYFRFDGERGRAPIPVLEYKQMSGRAGRPKYDDYGEAVLLAKSFDERSFLLDNYILASPETIYSKLAVEGVLRTHVLATIAMGYASSLEGLFEFFGKTFYAYQQEAYLLEGTLRDVVDFLLEEGFIEEKDGYLQPTLFGSRVSELYIDPVSAVIIRDGLKAAGAKATTPFSYLHLISRATELATLYLRQKDYELCSQAVFENEGFILTEIPSQLSDPWGYEAFLSEVKTALFFLDWIDERSEDFLLKKYNLGPGDIRNKVELADWLLYSAVEIGRIFKTEKAGEINALRMRVRHGIREELLPLISLKGIGRVRARRLYARGFRTLQDLKKADASRIARVELIGEKLAVSIKKQLGEVVEEKDVREERKKGKTGGQRRLMDF